MASLVLLRKPRTLADAKAVLSGQQLETDIVTRGKTSVFRTVRPQQWNAILITKEKEWNPVVGQTYLMQLDGFENYLDLTQSLTSYKSEGALYNNTENSLNSLGIYYTYLSVCRYIQENLVTPTYVIPRDSFSFYRHLTTGKTVARSAGLENVVQNLTVSLSNNTKLNYETTLAQGRVTQTKLPDEDLPLGMSATPSILLQFSSTWERLQAEPYFSNSFTKVTYQTNWVDDPATFELASPSVVVQFVYEYQLSWLLPLTLPT